MADIKEVAKQFVDYYYQTFDQNRPALGSLYRNGLSTLTWEGQEFKGADDITEKIVSLPFAKVQHRVATMDVQQTSPGGNTLLIVVTGQLLVDEETNPQQFTQVFQLANDNGFFVLSDFFRLNYA